MGTRTHFSIGLPIHLSALNFASSFVCSRPGGVESVEALCVLFPLCVYVFRWKEQECSHSRVLGSEEGNRGCLSSTQIVTHKEAKGEEQQSRPQILSIIDKESDHQSHPLVQMTPSRSFSFRSSLLNTQAGKRAYKAFGPAPDLIETAVEQREEQQVTGSAFSIGTQLFLPLHTLLDTTLSSHLSKSHACEDC